MNLPETLSLTEYVPGYEKNRRDAEKLEAELADVLAWLGPVSHTTKECLRQDLRLERDFPNQFVAFIDQWRKSDDGTRCLVREVIDAASDKQELNNRIAELSATIQRKIQIKFVKDPNAAVEGRSTLVV
jgi:hypothetical protein